MGLPLRKIRDELYGQGRVVSCCRLTAVHGVFSVAGGVAELSEPLESRLVAILNVLREQRLRQEGPQPERERLQRELTSAVHQVWERTRS